MFAPLRYLIATLPVLVALPAAAVPRPCDDASDCLPGWVCEYPVGDCLRENGNCEPAPTCGSIEGLVCGCDFGSGSTTYVTACDAVAAEGVVGSLGACHPGGSCGGQSCTGNTFCQLPMGACPDLLPESCPYGRAGPRDHEIAGQCVPWPDTCGPESDPVCGCNGRTYPNACEAARAFASVRKEGSCTNGGCGGFTGDACPANNVCVSCLLCGAFDAPGSCLPDPAACDDSCAPVCSCSGVWYRNHCEWLFTEPTYPALAIGLGELGGCGEIIGVAFHTDNEMTWVGRSSPTTIEYNVYRTLLTPAGQPGTWNCQASGLTSVPYQATGAPSPGQVWAYAVSLVEDGVEGPFGWGGAGCTERVNATPCSP